VSNKKSSPPEQSECPEPSSASRISPYTKDAITHGGDVQEAAVRDKMDVDVAGPPSVRENGIGEDVEGSIERGGVTNGCASTDNGNA